MNNNDACKTSFTNYYSRVWIYYSIAGRDESQQYDFLDFDMKAEVVTRLLSAVSVKHKKS